MDAEPNPRQRELLDRLGGKDDRLRLRYQAERGVFTLIAGRLAPGLVVGGEADRDGATGRVRKGQGGRDGTPAHRAFLEFLGEHGELVGPAGLAGQLRLLGEDRDPLGVTRLRFQWTYRAGSKTRSAARSKSSSGAAAATYPIYLCHLSAHVDADGALVAVQSSCFREIEVPALRRLSDDRVAGRLLRGLTGHPELPSLEKKFRVKGGPRFPLLSRPQLVVLRHQGRFRWALVAQAITLSPEAQPDERTPTPRLVFLAAESGEVLHSHPLHIGADTAVTGSGTGVLPTASPVYRGSLPMTEVSPPSPARYELRTVQAGTTITVHQATSVKDASAPVASQTSSSNFSSSTTQRPQVDALYFATRIHDWYKMLDGAPRAIGTQDGWTFPSGTTPTIPVHLVCNIPSDGNSEYYQAIGTLPAYIKLPDGVTSGWGASTYRAGSAGIVAHEYQHGITDHCLASLWTPTTPPSSWQRALHEGLSDAFGALFAEEWKLGLAVSQSSPNPVPVRDLASPRVGESRDNYQASPPLNKDYWPEYPQSSLVVNTAYDYGTILAHAAFLMDSGGVHIGRVRESTNDDTTSLIPVRGLGTETVNGLASDLRGSRTARIFYWALVRYFVPAGDGAAAGEMFVRFRDACWLAARQLYGLGSIEEKTTELAFHAVGLEPPATVPSVTGTFGATRRSYGVDLTFLTWGWDWRRSKSYAPLPGWYAAWSSHDLFIANEGMSAGWTVQVGNNPDNTPYRNRLFCRVRNVGDTATSSTITVAFEWAKHGTAPVVWNPVLDGNTQTQQRLTILSNQPIAAYDTSFRDDEQPPTSPTAGRHFVYWHIPLSQAAGAGEHFCVRATVSSAEDVNGYNNVVQSNLADVTVKAARANGFSFMAGNPTRDPLPIQLRLDAALPATWKLALVGHDDQPPLQPGEERRVQLRLDVPEDAQARLEPPYDGLIEATLEGELCGTLSGYLAVKHESDGVIAGALVGQVGKAGTFSGWFEGRLDGHRGEVTGRAAGRFQGWRGGDQREASIGLAGTLRPRRDVDITQLDQQGTALGGITVRLSGELERKGDD